MAVSDVAFPGGAQPARPDGQHEAMSPAASVAGIPVRRIRWRACYRMIPSRFPPINLFERVSDPDDLDAVIALESMTNDRLRDEVGDIQLVPADQRVAGPGAGYVMAAFTHTPPGGGRFSDARHGAYYAGQTLATSIAETSYHRAKFMAATKQPPLHLDMRVLVAELDARMHDIRGMKAQLPAVYDPDDYGASQAFARAARRDGSDGIAYDSVRLEGGRCVAVFNPRRVRNCREVQHLTYVWDGERITGVYEKRDLPGNMTAT